MAIANIKPLGRKAYGSIGHLPNSRLGPSDSSVSPGQAKICTTLARDKHDVVFVQEKLDGSCTAVARIGDEIVALGRAGWRADSSPHEQHRLFSDWVRQHESRFRSVLNDGERLVGEWLAQAHGTRYEIRGGYEPWAPFDLMIGGVRLPFTLFFARASTHFLLPHLLHSGGPIPVEDALSIHEAKRWPCDEIEGVVYRVERRGKVDFLAKHVRHNKIDGKYLPEVSGQPAVWNWRPQVG